MTLLSNFIPGANLFILRGPSLSKKLFITCFPGGRACETLYLVCEVHMRRHLSNPYCDQQYIFIEPEMMIYIILETV